MIRSILILAWCSAWAAYAVYCLMLGQSMPWLHAFALVIHATIITIVLRSALRRRRALRRLDAIKAYSRSLLRVQAWGTVYMDRLDRCSPLADQSRLSLFAAMDRAASEKARLVNDGVLP